MSETMEDTKKGSLAEVTDDSCTLEYIEIVPLDRPSDDYHTSEFISPVVEVKPEDLQEIKQEPADESDNGDSHCYVKQEPAVGYGIAGSWFTTEVSSFIYIHVQSLSRSPLPVRGTVYRHLFYVHIAGISIVLTDLLCKMLF